MIGIITSFYKGSKYLERYFEGLVQIESPELVEVIFVHNVPTENEISIVSEYIVDLPFTFKHILVTELETIYASWNRAMIESSCDYYTFWNVDDYRDPDSIVRQGRTLDKFPEIGVTYGNQINISKLGQIKGQFIEALEFNKEQFLRGCCAGSFVMWRKSLIDKYGLFDEQFKSGGDFEYWVRLVANGVVMRKTQGIIGYFLNERQGASTDGSGLQPIERTVVELRYGIFDKIDYSFLVRARKYDIECIYYKSKSFDVRHDISNYDTFIKERKYLWFKSINNNFKRSSAKFFLKVKLLLRFFLPSKCRRFIKSFFYKPN